MPRRRGCSATPARGLPGREVEVLVPERFRASHPGHRGGYFLDSETRAMGAGTFDLWGLEEGRHGVSPSRSASALSPRSRASSCRVRSGTSPSGSAPTSSSEASFPSAFPRSRGAAGGPLRTRRGRRRGRGRLVRRARARRRTHRARDRRRRRAGRSGGSGHGPASQRLARIRFECTLPRSRSTA